eukprot:181627-Rhodomonas_salina.2
MSVVQRQDTECTVALTGGVVRAGAAGADGGGDLLAQRGRACQGQIFGAHAGVSAREGRRRKDGAECEWSDLCHGCVYSRIETFTGVEPAVDSVNSVHTFNQTISYWRLAMSAWLAAVSSSPDSSSSSLDSSSESSVVSSPADSPLCIQTRNQETA